MSFTGLPSRFSLRCCHSGTGMQTSGTVAGIYGIRRLQVKRSGRLGARAVLAPDCCLPQGTWSGFGAKVRAVSSVRSQYVINENTPSSYDDRVSYKKVAATYSPTWWGSTIGDGELNFSVRNGKRWILTAITATVCF